MRYFEFSDDKSNKFWEVSPNDCELNLRWGKRGTQGQSQVKTFDDANKAAMAMAKLVKEKLGKGYVEVDRESGTTPVPPTQTVAVQSNERTATPTEPAKKAPSAKAILPIESQDFTPAWHSSQLQLTLPKNLYTAFPSRTQSGQSLLLDQDADWDNVCSTWQHTYRYTSVLALKSDPQLHELCQFTVQRMQAGEHNASPEADALLMALQPLPAEFYLRDSDHLVCFLIAQHGLETTIEIFLASLQYRTQRASGAMTGIQVLRQPKPRQLSEVTQCEQLLRTALAQTDAETWARCAAKIQAAEPHVHISQKPTLAFLLPDLPEFANAMALDFANAGWDADYSLLACVCTSDEAFQAILQALTSKALEHLQRFGQSTGWQHIHCTEWILGLIERQNQAAFELLQHLGRVDEVADVLAYVHHPRALIILTRYAQLDANSKKRFTTACYRFPHAAICALAEMALANPREAFIQHQLTSLVTAHIESVQQIQPWLDAASRELIQRLIKVPPTLASPAELPSVLQTAPWLSKKTPRYVITLAQLELADEANWTEPLIRRYGQLSGWQAEKVAECRESSEAFYSRFGFGYANNSKKLTAIKQGFTQAVHDNQAAGIIAAWQALLAQPDNESQTFDANILSALPAATALQVWQGLCDQDSYHVEAGALLYHCGVEALPGLIPKINADPNYYFASLIAIGSCELAPLAAKLFARHKKLRADAQNWLLAHPAHAITGLLPIALGKDGPQREDAAMVLRFLNQHGRRDLLLEMASRYQQESVTAALIALLNEDPLSLFPAKIPKAPDFFQALACARPILQGSNKALTDEAMTHLGTMLRFPTAEGVYPGLIQVKESCTAPSLADFAWDVFTQWQFAGAPSKEGWAFTQLGILGNDSTARQLTPMIRQWPSEGLSARAVTGLDILETIGSDIALMLLNGIAQKVKSKALQDHARKKIAQIAQARELSSEELADRLVPDLGLDEHGTMKLDFGPRQFLVGFDETLKPFVRDMDGVRLKDLPKPKQSDDSELASAATECFKLLKKDVRTIASQQVHRLETAMCQRRRWPVTVFSQFLAAHPLVRHLVQRLVWGVYSATDSLYGGELQTCFRVAADGSYTTAEDDQFALPAGEICIGLPHALELDAADGTAFAQLLADYELLQPFTQLGRDCYSLSNTETELTELTRWHGKIVATGKIMGLSHRGWRRGNAQDGGAIWYYTKDIGNDRLIELLFSPGMNVDFYDESEQTLENLSIGMKNQDWHSQSHDTFATLDAITASELIRDMDMLIN